eukprot:TRINITY_DN845_c0_g1_i3.p1 TRINITY_DN845_c0_g1~~TRINITY_DN845_c0_g1_i3.p1  ORF type:complete len:1027 (-),score=201.31 TRINITY_DN845_c0_g1_i3:76-3156(-)
MLAFTALLSLASVTHAQDPALAREYQYNIAVSTGSYYLYWTKHGNSIDIAVACLTTGWVNFGIGPTNDDHTNGDFIVGVGTSLRDGWSFERNVPSFSETDNLVNKSISVVNGWTTFRFNRALTTTDTKDRPIFASGPTKIVWAYGPCSNLGDCKHTASTRGLLNIDFSIDPNLGFGGTVASDPNSALYQNMVVLDPKFRLYWTVTGSTIKIAARAMTTGWITIGFEPEANNPHLNTDLIVGSDTGGVKDYFSTTYATPTLDTSQDITGGTAVQTGSETTISFTRNLGSTDAKDKPITAGQRPMVWGYSTGDAITVKHASNTKGLALINWLAGPGIPTSLDVTAVVPQASTGGGNTGSSYTFNSDLSMSWSLNPSAGTISITLTCKCSGWVAIGLDPSAGPHDNTDMIMGNGNGEVQDFWSTSLTTPALDTQQDINDISTHETNGVTVVSFSRKLTTGDVNDRPILPGQHKVVWAYHATSDAFTDKHTAQSGSTILNIDWYTGGVAPSTVLPGWTKALFYLVPLALLMIFSKLSETRYFHRLTKQFSVRINDQFVFGFSWGEALTFLGWIIINITWTSVYAYEVFGPYNQIGLMLQLHCSVLFVPALRNSIIEKLIGVSFDRAIKYHRWLAYSFTVVLVVHGMGTWGEWNAAGIFSIRAKEPAMVWGEVSFFLALFLLVFAFTFFRRNQYEVFLGVHFLFPFVIIFAILHTDTLIPFFLPSIILYVIDRAIRTYHMMKPVTGLKCTEVNGLTRIEMDRPFKFQAGQYVFVLVPMISKFEWHPFSIASAPEDDKMVLCVRAVQGGWTGQLLALAHNAPSTLNMRLDGPYGLPSVNHFSHEVVVMVSGGVGAVPFISMLRELILIKTNPQRNQKLADKCKIKKVYFIWSCRNAKVAEWFDDTWALLNESGLSSFVDLRIYVTTEGIKKIPGAHGQGHEMTEAQKTRPIHADAENSAVSGYIIEGRPNYEGIMEECVVAHPEVSKFAMMCCGPRGMGYDLARKTWQYSAQSKKSQKKDIVWNYHCESFEF